MNVSLFISKRLRLRNGSSSSLTGVVIAVIGVALAVMIMEFTLAIVTGFRDGITDKLTGFDAQITIEPPLNPADGLRSEAIRQSDELTAIVQSTLPGCDMRLSLRQPGLLKTDDNFMAVIFLGQDPAGDFSFERSNILRGTLPDYSQDSCLNKIVISEKASMALGVDTGSRIYTTFIDRDGNIKLRRPEVAGIYSSNFPEYDATMAYASPAMLRRVAGLDSLAGTRLDIRGIDPDDISDKARLLQENLIEAVAHNRLQEYYPVDNIEHTGAVFYNWLALLDTNVVVIFILMLAVAGLTLISSLFILILDRVPLIGILRALGAPRSTVRRIFIDMAMRLVGAGMIIGNVLAIGLLLIQFYGHVIPLDPEMYYLPSVPVKIVPRAFIILNIGVALTAWLILLLPARVASSVSPAKAMNFD